MVYRILRKYTKVRQLAISGRSKSKAWLLFYVVVSTFSSVTGCTAVNGSKDCWSFCGMWDEKMMQHRTDAWANKSWHSRKHQFCREKHLHEFCDGFRAGYEMVADGSQGAEPAFPPRKYWGWKYQSAEGAAKVSSWYAGFPHGARAAEEDGIGNFSQIQTSTSVQKNFDQQGMLGPGQTPGMYPMPQAQPVGVAYAKQLKEQQAKGGSTEALLSEAPKGLEYSSQNQGTLLSK